VSQFDKSHNLLADKELVMTLNAQMKLFPRYNQDQIEVSGIDDYLKNGGPAYHHGGFLVFDNGDSCETVTVLVKDGLIYSSNNTIEYLGHQSGDNMLDDDTPCAVIINTNKRVKENANCKLIALLNGDDNDHDGPEMGIENFCHNMPTVSFACLSRFYHRQGELGNYRKVINRLASGDIKILDYTLDQRRKLSEKDKKIMRRKVDNMPRPPEAGFTLLGNASWHRSGTVLFYDSRNSVCILMGQDEDTYFGVQLPKRVNTISEAYKLLMPSEVVGKSFKRQGEWFMVPVEDKQVPNLLDCTLVIDQMFNGMHLPIESEDSNKHYLSSYDVRVGKDGRIYAHNPSLTHEQHADVSGHGWFTFHRNTAVRSFSQEGVD
jgi:hypothetical protein